MIVYRRTEELMPANKDEIEAAKKEGIEFKFNTKVVSAISENGKIKKIRCIKTQIVDNKLIEIKDSDFELEANNIIFAIGLYPNQKIISDLKINSEKGLIVIDKNGMTNIPGIFAGGDLVKTKSTVAEAIKIGKNAAEGIENYIYENFLFSTER